MIVDGRAAAAGIFEDIREYIKRAALHPTLSVLSAAPDRPTRSFLSIKERAARAVGVSMLVTELPEGASTKEVVTWANKHVQRGDGIILQLPFPLSIDVERVLRMLPRSHDVDAIGDEAKEALRTGTHDILPPVVGAIAAIVATHRVDLKNKRAVVVGKGRLVGAPTALWLAQEGALVTVLERDASDAAAVLRGADVAVLGAGVPHFITPDMLKDGVVVFDAGTSEDGGKLVGDADPRCAEKASLFTPVPGGIGPMTIAMIFKNLLALRYGYDA